MEGIEGLVNKRSSHASGVVLFDEDPFEFSCFMKTPSWEVITQYDLHDAEYCGLTKYDFLVTEIQDKILATIKFLQADKQIDPSLKIREVYDKYLAPDSLDLNDSKIWKALENGEVLNVFQFDSEVGAQAAKKIKPHTIQEMADSNGLMRLAASEKGAEPPMEKYIRYKKDISLWYQEMQRYGLTSQEISYVEPHFKKSYGVPPSQEQLMEMLMDKNICNFTLGEANAARKIIGKKIMEKVPELQQKVMDRASSPALGKYIWECGIKPQASYSFSLIHALAYSFIGIQTLFLGTAFNPVYWNTACLVVNSGSLDETQNKSTDYGKVAKAVGEIMNRGIKMSLVDINYSDYGFKPDPKHNQIYTGLKVINQVGDPVIEKIIANRPYSCLRDFVNRSGINKIATLNLIKAGAFDNLDGEWASKIGNPRIVLMIYFLMQIAEFKNKLTLQNFNGIINKNILPETLDSFKHLFFFNKKIKKNINKAGYKLSKDDIKYICDNHYEMVDYIDFNGNINNKIWDKYYKTQIENVRIFLNEPKTLKLYNFLLFKEKWDKYALETAIDTPHLTSAWEMESLCFYVGHHELENVNIKKYGIVNFFDLNREPEVDYYFKRKNFQIPIYKTFKIIGTVLAKNDPRSSISLLTVNGVVNVKFTKEYYAMFGRQLSEKQEDGTNKIVEKGWFKRGTKLMITGFRREDTFIAKRYKHTSTHQLYKITNVTKEGDIEVNHERYGQTSEN